MTFILNLYIAMLLSVFKFINCLTKFRSFERLEKIAKIPVKVDMMIHIHKGFQQFETTMIVPNDKFPRSTLSVSISPPT